MNMFNDNKTSPNVKWHHSCVKHEDRCKIVGQDNKVLWFTGLSGSGKSTIAHALEEELCKRGILAYVLDGDNVRHGLNKDLGFSKEERDENIRRIGEVSKLFYDAGVMILVCFISPYRSERQDVRELIGEDFIEVFVDCSLEECERRDTKGLYKKARAGEIKDFTGISSPYEKPENAEVVIKSDNTNLLESVEKIIDFLGI